MITLQALTRPMAHKGCAFVLIFVLFGAGCHSPKPSFRFEGNVVVVAKVNGKLTVRPKGGESLLGHIEKTKGCIQFTPQFPLLTGETYEAIFIDSAGQQTILEHTIAINAPEPRITAIYPSARRLPANHLKFYLHFTEPMQQGKIFKHFNLIDLKDNQPVKDPFRETELWSADGKRLTLWLHPGRQKTGVNLNVDLGPILMPDRHYTLEISAQWKSQAGVTLKQSAHKHFVTTVAERNKLDISHWQFTTPSASSRDPLQLAFPKPLDSALLQNLITIENANDQTISGTIKLSQNETRWSFVPLQPWTADDYRVRVDWELEDLAGNNLKRPFELNLQSKTKPTFEGPHYFQFHLK